MQLKHSCRKKASQKIRMSKWDYFRISNIAVIFLSLSSFEFVCALFKFWYLCLNRSHNRSSHESYIKHRNLCKLNVDLWCMLCIFCTRFVPRWFLSFILCFFGSFLRSNFHYRVPVDIIYTTTHCATNSRALCNKDTTQTQLQRGKNASNGFGAESGTRWTDVSEHPCYHEWLFFVVVLCVSYLLTCLL